MIAGLVDVVFGNPTVQGRAWRLFPDGHPVPDLRLIEPPKSFDRGITLLKYAGFAAA